MSPFYRLYRYLDLWRVDGGDPSTSQDFEEVIVSCPASTNEDCDKSWIEFYDAILEEKESIGYISGVVDVPKED